MAESAAKIRVKKKFQALSDGCICAVCAAMGIKRPASCEHHIMHRASSFLFGNPDNGLPVCILCHHKIHNQPGFADWVHNNVVGTARMKRLFELNQTDFKQFLLNHAMTADEFWNQTSDALDNILIARRQLPSAFDKYSDLPF